MIAISPMSSLSSCSTTPLLTPPPPIPISCMSLLPICLITKLLCAKEEEADKARCTRIAIRIKYYRKQLVSCPFSWAGSPRVHFQVQDRLLSFYRECDEPKNTKLQCSIAKYHPHFINQEFRKTLYSISSTKSVSQHQI